MIAEALNVLLIAAEADADLIRHLDAAGAGFAISVESRMSGAVAALSTTLFDVVLLDLELPEGSGVGTFALIQFAAGALPVVVLTGGDDPEGLGLRSVQAGAEDYIVRDEISGRLLWRTLRHAVERRRAARRIEYQSQLLDQVGQAVVAADTDNIIQYWNAAAESLYGWRAADAVGRHMAEVLPEDPATHQAAAERRRAESWSGEMSTQRKDGSLLIAAVTVSTLHDATGAVVGRVGVSTDVTEQRAAEQALRENEQRLRLVVDSMPALLWTTDADLRITSLRGGAVERVVGSPERAMGVSIAEFTTAESLSHSRRALAGDAVSATVEWSGFAFDYHIEPLRDASGAITGTVGMALDVTRQRLAEERQNRLTDIIEASPDFVATFDVERRTLYLNRAGRRIVGLSPDQTLEGTTLEQFCTASTTERLEQEALPHALADQTWSGECTLAAIGGEEVLVWATIVAHRRADGTFAFISVVAQDISQRRFLEDQLRQSQKMEAVGRLAGGVAHDFNNLMTAVAGHAQLLLEEIGEQKAVRADVEEILRAVDRASALTRQLLAFSRRQVLQPRLLDVSRVITEVGRLLRRLIGEDVELARRLKSGLPLIRADRSQIEQVVMNLVVNAREAMPDGGAITLSTGVITVCDDSDDARRGVVAGDYVEITVADNGVGMDEELMARIFEPFFTTRELGRGTGLGLSTVYGIVTQTGGFVLSDSEPGVGSTFRVLLPAVAGPHADTPEVVAAVDEGGSETVLLVEDEAAVRRLGCRILERKGYSVIEADSGAEAIRVFEQKASAIVLLVTDVVMPGMSGVELARRLRAMKPSLRVLLTSGYTADAISKHGELDEDTAFLEKPFTPDALIQKVRDVLDNRER